MNAQKFREICFDYIFPKLKSTNKFLRILTKRHQSNALPEFTLKTITWCLSFERILHREIFMRLTSLYSVL